MQWMPIESAPKETFVIAWREGWSRPTLAIYTKIWRHYSTGRIYRKWGWGFSSHDPLPGDPTHFMHLPPPPEQQE